MRCFFLQGRGPRAWTRNEFRRGERDREGDSWLVTCWSWHQLRPVSNDPITCHMFLRFDWSPPALNSVDWTWCGKAHTCLYLTVQVRPQTKKSEELSVDLQAQIWGRVSAPGRPNEHSGLRHPHMEKVWKVLQRRMGETAQNEGYHSLNSRV